jgi:hypothetical protein
MTSLFLLSPRLPTYTSHSHVSFSGHFLQRIKAKVFRYTLATLKAISFFSIFLAILEVPLTL